MIAKNNILDLQKILLLDRESNPSRLGEDQESWPLDHLGRAASLETLLLQIDFYFSILIAKSLLKYSAL